jgi:6-phosphogluconolactonase
MPGPVEFRPFADRAAASGAAAELLAGQLRNALDATPRAQASLVVSGGTTPGPCFDLLSRAPLDWSRVTVIPSDERWVPASDPASNEGLIRARLLTRQAASGRVLSFYRAGIDAAQAPPEIERDLAGLAQPFSATLLGMGEDGHFASLFADFDGLQMALDPNNPAACVLVKTARSPYPRISLTLSALLNSVHTVLLLFGAAKRVVFESASAGGSPYPVESLLRQTRKPLTVMWAP